MGISEAGGRPLEEEVGVGGTRVVAAGLLVRIYQRSPAQQRARELFFSKCRAHVLRGHAISAARLLRAGGDCCRVGGGGALETSLVAAPAVHRSLSVAGVARRAALLRDPVVAAPACP